MKNHSLIFFNPKSCFSQIQVFEILQKVRHNIPDANIANLKGISLNKIRNPVFVESAKNLTSSYAKSLFLANLIQPFELVVFYNKLSEIKTFKHILSFAKFLNKNLLPKKVKEALYNLNINFSSQEFSKDKKDGITVDGYGLGLVEVKNNYIKSAYKSVFVKQTYFNGYYYFFKNEQKNNKKLNILIKKIFYFNNFNYFLLKKEKRYYLYDLKNNQKYYLLSNQKIYPKIQKTKCGKGVVLQIQITFWEDAVVYIGREKINVLDFGLEQKILDLVAKNFEHKVFLNNQKLEQFFNVYLPKKILASKILENNNINEIAYQKIKKMFVFRNNNIVVFNMAKNNNVVYQTVFRGKTKTIHFFNGNKKVVVGGVEYKNTNSVTSEVFEKFDEFIVFG